MRTDYDHLTPAQRRQLERAVVILREEFAKAIKGKGWTRTRQLTPNGWNVGEGDLRL